MTAIDETHDADLRSWVESANDPSGDFPIQNLPLGIFGGPDGVRRAGVAIGDRILALDSVLVHGLLDGEARAAAEATATGTLNRLMASGHAARRTLRAGVSRLLRADTDAGARAKSLAGRLLVAATDVEMLLPADIGDYTDFYASIHHATNVGSMFRPDNPLLPNYKWVPIGYHGRASSIVASGSRIVRPSGQTKGDTDAAPTFGPSKRLDYELEVGAYVGSGNDLGASVTLADVEERLFGLSLVNDWSARDIQAWEYQPLGPFLAKNFATTVSPWIVTLDALAPFRAPAFTRAASDPEPLPYLRSGQNESAGAFDIHLEVWLRSERMRHGGTDAVRLTTVRFTEMYWTLAQLVAHHASNGCNLRPGDLIASGTVSGPTRESRGCLLELTWRG
ncbi:MAG TPA: fumarylacetoacetase, partial [Gemmatimonadaceae bacterium]|nr:fumarylacetoacetase [Gemmatimonadaceae bacterium]